MNDNCCCMGSVMTQNNCANMRYGYAYVLPQVFTALYPLNEALVRGTLFKELDIPMSEYGK